VREAFLRAGPGRELGSAVRKQPTPTHLSSSPQSRVSPRSSSSSFSSSLDSTTLDAAATGPDSTSSSVADTSDIATEAFASATVTTSASTSTPSPTFKYKEITILDTDFRERFIKGGGNGGQKINKTNSNVELKHYETGIVVQCQATRSLPQNRKLARRILIERLDEYYNGEMSKRGQKAEKIREKKKRMARKSAKKYHGSGTAGAEDSNDNDDDDDDDGEADNGGGDQQGQDMKIGQNAIPENTIQLTTLEEVLASDNKKPSRRKAARK
ncbi:hypothetical protein BG011_005077, partial [Mortierella polycephala]